MAIIVDALIDMCRDGKRFFSTDLVTWSDTTRERYDLILTNGKVFENLEDLNNNVMIKVVDDAYKKELLAFFEDPSVVGCKKFGLLRCFGMETLTITKNIDKCIHVVYDDYDVDDETNFEEVHVAVSLDDANPEDFGLFQNLIKIMAQYK